MLRYRSVLICLILLQMATLATARETPNALTHGMVQMTVKVGVTTQAEVLENFGAPNITTLDGTGQEMWVYDRHATVSYDKQSGFSIGILGGGGGGGGAGVGGLGFGSRKSQSSESSRTMTLILKFSGAKVVSDFQSRSSSF